MRRLSVLWIVFVLLAILALAATPSAGFAGAKISPDCQGGGNGCSG